MNLSLNVFATPQQADSPFRVVGYLPDYRIDQVNASWMTRLTDLVYFSIQPDKSGELDLGHLEQPSIEKLRQLTRKIKFDSRYVLVVGEETRDFLLWLRIKICVKTLSTS